MVTAVAPTLTPIGKIGRIEYNTRGGEMRLLGEEVTPTNAASLVERLVSDQAAEDERLEFKIKLPKKTDEARDEFLRDVSAFANHRGGTLVFGIASVKGVASKLIDLGVANPDAEILRLESMLEGVQPRLHVEMVPVRHANGLSILLGIPRSFGGPHMALGPSRLGQFWKRGVAGKVLMDATQVRRAILDGADWLPTVERFREERIQALATEVARTHPDKTPEALLLHVLPLGGPRDYVDLPTIDRDWREHLLNMLVPYAFKLTDVVLARSNLDGWFSITGNREEAKHCQLFRQGGGVEVRWDLSIFKKGRSSEQSTQLSGIGLEVSLVQRIARSFDWFRVANIDPPYAVAVTLLGCAGLTIEADHYVADDTLLADYTIQESAALLPVAVFDQRPENLVPAIRPTFDILWQAASWPRSPFHRPNGDPTYVIPPNDLKW